MTDDKEQHPDVEVLQTVHSKCWIVVRAEVIGS